MNWCKYWTAETPLSFCLTQPLWRQRVQPMDVTCIDSWDWRWLASEGLGSPVQCGFNWHKEKVMFPKNYSDCLIRNAIMMALNLCDFLYIYIYVNTWHMPFFYPCEKPIIAWFMLFSYHYFSVIINRFQRRSVVRPRRWIEQLPCMRHLAIFDGLGWVGIIETGWRR